MKKDHSDPTKLLAGQLDRLAEIREFDEGEEKQAAVVAQGLAHISESLEELQDLVLRLRSEDLTDEERLDMLWDIGEQLRHVDDHIHDMAFFDTLLDEGDGGEEELDS